MKITIINGSTRKGSESIKIANYFKSILTAEGACVADILDLSEKILPIYDASEPENLKELVGEISTMLESSEGFVLVSPEWDGMFSVGILNMLHYIDKEMADKPVLLVSVSAGRGGRYPLAQARAMGYKNKRFVVVPESIFIDEVGENFVDGKFVDVRTTERVAYDTEIFLEYAKALKSVRASGKLNYTKYPNGL